MQALTSSLGSTTTRGMGGSLPDKPGVYRVVRFEMRKMRPEGLADSKERARSSPAKAEGGWWAHGAISRSFEQCLQKSESVTSRFQHPARPQKLPQTLSDRSGQYRFPLRSLYRT